MKSGLTAIAGLLLLAFAAGALLTVRSIALDGFASTRSVSTVQTAVRLAAVLAAIALWRPGRDPLTRIALACWMIAAGSSALHYGLGLNSTPLQAVRQIFHLLAYALSAIVLAKFLRTRPTRLAAFHN